MRLYILQGVFLQKLFQVFVKMAVIIIAIKGIMKVTGRINQMGGCFPDPHHLQGLFAANAGTGFEIAL